MDIARIQREFVNAQRTFALVELHSMPDGKVYARTALQTGNGRHYVLSIMFPDTYPNEIPCVFIDAPTVTYAPHRYQAGNICYLHPRMWNPGVHHLTFVIARAAKWLNKYEVWRNNGGTWPGAEMSHEGSG
jgi:ubiquitin-protein ligase